MVNDLDGYKRCVNNLTTRGVPWYKDKGVVRLNTFISVVFTGQLLNGFDDSLLGGYQALNSWREALNYPSNSSIGLLSAAAYIAGFFTAPVAAYVADRWGRRWCVRYSALTMLLGSMLGALSGVDGADGYGLFIASRVVIGSGLAFCLMISPIMLQELPHPSQRVFLAALFNCNYAIGGFTASWLTFGTSYINNNWSWRIPYIVQIVPALYLVIAIQFVPETPRWLMSKGREEEAMEFLVKYHGNGDPQDELVLFEFEEMKSALHEERTRHQDSWSQLFATKGNRHRIAIVLLIVSCQNLSGTAIIGGYYTQILSLVGITNTQQQTGINAGLTGWVFISAIIGASIVNRVKRRTLLMGTWAALILVNIAFTVTAARYTITGSKAAAIGNVVLLWLYDGTFFIVCGPLFFSYQTEVLTFSTRAKGMMIWGISNKVISIFNAYVNSIALERIGFRYYIVYTCILSAQLVGMYFLAVETTGLTLEEIAILFDGEESTAPHVDIADIEHKISEKKGQADGVVQSVKSVESA
ncbi:general substrate transporter [Leucosporidium creatinivorum]|uniref:General substrate transporter n=1 Tax=Leucosporidium creatinivorum TaxID=106004 RepID=A0A1Y2CZ84_9BASI|nr:general substrate transporter [Leucosporidium creatinivorum]